MLAVILYHSLGSIPQSCFKAESVALGRWQSLFDSTNFSRRRRFPAKRREDRIGTPLSIMILQNKLTILVMSGYKTTLPYYQFKRIGVLWIDLLLQLSGL